MFDSIANNHQIQDPTLVNTYYPSQASRSSSQQTSSKVGRGRAHSKIILMGEHAVVYDYPGIAIPFKAVQAEVEVQALPHGCQESEFDCVYHVGPFSQAPEALENLMRAVELTQSSFDLPEAPIKVSVRSSIPRERGMGSSAAVAVALVRALCDYYDCQITQGQLHYIVNEAEVIAHQSTSGLDTLITSSEHPVIYQKSLAPESFQLSLDAYLVVADSGAAGKTRQAVGHVADLRQKKPNFVTDAMEAIGSFVMGAYRAVCNQDAEELGRMMSYNHYYLNQIEVSNSRLDQIVSAAWLSGALGAKLTGAGLGGCVIALASDRASAQAVAQAMEAAGAVQSWYIHLL